MMNDEAQEKCTTDRCRQTQPVRASYLAQQLRLFLTALMFYTRVPCSSSCSRWVGFSQELLTKSVRFLPVVGWLVGGVTVGVVLLSLFVFPLELSVALAMVASLFLTGAFHEDGLADVCDGFGGGWTQERILTIMKDSRLGTYGAAALFTILGVKFLALVEIVRFVADPVILLLLFMGAHGMSRMMAIVTMVTHDYVREDELSKAKPVVKDGLSWTTPSFLWAGVFALVPFVFFPKCLLVLLPMVLVKIGMARFFKKWIGGYTGDCLGAIQQVTEVVFYLGVIALWSFI